MIALIRKNLLENEMNDPFANGFSYDLLEIGSCDQNYLYIADFIEKCKSLPVENIIQLGQKNTRIADYILKDCSSSADYFQISQEFTAIPELRKKIAENWQAYFENHSLPKQQKLFCCKGIEGLKSQAS